MAVTLKIKLCFLAKVLKVDGRLSLPHKGLSLPSTTEAKVNTKAGKDATSHFEIQIVYYVRRKED